MDYIKDLGIYLDSKLLFRHHIDFIVQKAFRLLGFIFRMSREFKNVKTIITLYMTFVRSGLEFGSVVWSPCYCTYIDQIERIQRRFIKHLNFKFCPDRISASYERCLSDYRMMSLANRRLFLDFSFLYKLLNNKIDSFYCMQNINFNVTSYSTRLGSTFYLHKSNTIAHMNSPLYRLCTNYMNNFRSIDIFYINQRTAMLLAKSKLNNWSFL